MSFYVAARMNLRSIASSKWTALATELGVPGENGLTLRDHVEMVRRASVQACVDYRTLWAALAVLQVVTYSDFFTALIFTNHTFPNSWVYASLPSKPSSRVVVALESAYHLAIVLAAVGLYYISITITMLTPLADRAHINSITDMARSIASSYSTFAIYFSTGSDHPPALLRFLPALVIGSGAPAIAVPSQRSSSEFCSC